MLREERGKKKNIFKKSRKTQKSSRKEIKRKENVLRKIMRKWSERDRRDDKRNARCKQIKNNNGVAINYINLNVLGDNIISRQT
jgi:hypothetical protein